MNVKHFNVKLLDTAKFMMDQDHNVSRPLLTEGNACCVTLMWSLPRISLLSFPSLLPAFPHCCLPRKVALTTLFETVAALSYSLAQFLGFIFLFSLSNILSSLFGFAFCFLPLLECKLHEKRKCQLCGVTKVCSRITRVYNCAWHSVDEDAQYRFAGRAKQHRVSRKQGIPCGHGWAVWPLAGYVTFLCNNKLRKGRYFFPFLHYGVRVTNT